MKTLTTLFALLPGMVLAHGGHAEVPPAAHGFVHYAPALVAGIAVGVVATTLFKRRG